WSPTGTVIGEPVSMTSVPRTRPSVGAMATARTFESPRCCATSAITFLVSPATVNSISTALRISGRPSGGNSMSTTGPATFTMRPLASLITRLRFSSLVGSHQGLRSTDDLGDGGGDLGLAGPVGLNSQNPDQLFGVVRRRLHGPAACRVLRRGGLEQHDEDDGLDVHRKQPGQDVVGRGLVLVGDPGGTLLLGHLR